MAHDLLELAKMNIVILEIVKGLLTSETSFLRVSYLNRKTNYHQILKEFA